jgi:LysM repeat protein
MRFPSARAVAAALLMASAVAGAPRRGGAQSLRGSPESIDRMYARAVSEGLAFNETASDVRAAASNGALVPLVPSRNVTLRQVAFSYVTPTAEAFVERFAAQYRDACGKPLVVTSATRPTTRQPANSVPESVHPTGTAVDLRKPSGKCLRWLRATLLAMEKAGAIEATEERHPAHFHVAVFASAPLTQVAARPEQAPDKASTKAAAKTPARAAATVTAVSNGAVYRVRQGDTLWDIARKRDVTVARLRAANGLRRATIRPGQTLVIPSEAGAATSAADAGSQ